MGNSNKHNEQIESIPLDSLKNISYRSIHHLKERPKQFTLVWLDENAQEYSPDSLRMKFLLEQISNKKCFFFDNLEEFFNEINQLENEEILIIMSGSYAEKILSLKKHFHLKILVFCKDYFKYNYLIKQEDLNIVDICTEEKMLFYFISRQYPSLKFNLSLNGTSKSTRCLHPSDHLYLFYISFLQVSQQMSQTDQSKKCMLNKCRDFYQGNEEYLQHIDVFEENYRSDQAIDWYLKDSFVYRLINQAFRTDDVLIWYLFRYYLVDFCQQLKKVHQQQQRTNPRKSFTVYRGQILSTDEFEDLKRQQGQIIGINGFFSTSKDRRIAEMFIAGAENNDQTKSVLFQITLHAHYLDQVTFVDINKYLQIDEEDREQEILFLIGTRFLLQRISSDRQLDAWRIELETTIDGIDRIEQQRKLFRNENINLFFGQWLFEKKEYSLAESYFQMLESYLINEEKDLAVVYHHLGEIAMKTSNWNEAFKYFNRTEKIQQKIFKSNDPQIAKTWNSLGNYHKAIGNSFRALFYYTKVLQCQLCSYDIAATQLNMATVYLINQHYDEAIELCTKARTIFQKEDNLISELISCDRVIGEIHLARNQYPEAEKYFRRAWKMSREYLTIHNQNQTKCILLLADLYGKQGQHQRAEDFCSEYLNECQRELSTDHIHIAQISMKLAQFCNERKENLLKSALNILGKNAHLHYAALADCLMDNALVSQTQSNQELVEKYSRRALQIRKKIYPENHWKITEARNLIRQNKIKHC